MYMYKVENKYFMVILSCKWLQGTEFLLSALQAEITALFYNYY